jgi:DNA-binding transcriptional MocR family regulator
MSALAYFHTVSTQTQLLAENILADHKYCTDFFKESGLRLHKLKNYLDKKLETIGIKKYPSISGVFTWIDLREKFNIITFEDELKIFEMMLEKGRFNITPGQFFGASKPGQFRICFAKSEADIDEFITRVDALSL